MQSDWIQFPNSEEIKETIRNYQGKKEKGIPFERLLPGMSFAIPIDQANISSIKTMCSRYSKALGTQFKCYYHVKAGIVEVGRIDIIKVDKDTSLSISIE
jgi:hypothetical protein